jgi:hypothetical protein
MNKPLEICAGCRRHVRAGEASCPHCGVELSASGRLVPQQGRLFVRRVLVVGAAITGMFGSGCQNDVLGECASVSHYDCRQNCLCGTDGFCSDAGKCVSCGCNSDEVCEATPQGFQCFPAPPPSDHSCYGAPPLIV